MARPTFASRLRALLPPWLTRPVSWKAMGGIADVVDERATALDEGVAYRFPAATAEDALGLIGRDRRIRRGPEEPAATYVRRLLRWWDAHRMRGSSFEMLRQLHGFFRDSLDEPRIDIVATSGIRHWVDAGVEDATAEGVLTRDFVSWDPIPRSWHDGVALIANAVPGDTSVRITTIGDFDRAREFTTASGVSSLRVQARLKSGTTTEDVVVVGNDGVDRIYLAEPIAGTFNAGPSALERARIEWAHLWVFIYLDDAPTEIATLITHAGDTIVTSEGDEIVVVTDISGGGAMAEEAAERFKCIPREWKGAHIPYVTVVLLYGDGELWGYPAPMGTWGEPGGVWGADAPIVLIAE